MELQTDVLRVGIVDDLNAKGVLLELGLLLSSKVIPTLAFQFLSQGFYPLLEHPCIGEAELTLHEFEDGADTLLSIDHEPGVGVVFLLTCEEGWKGATLKDGMDEVDLAITLPVRKTLIWTLAILGDGTHEEPVLVELFGKGFD
jgi:hypothetical protein